MTPPKKRGKPGSAKGQSKPIKRSLDPEFPERLSRAMDAKKLSAPDLARAAGCERATIHNYLNGKSKQVEAFVLIRLADALDVAPAWLLLGREPRTPPKPIPPEFDRVLTTYGTLKSAKLREHWLKQAADLAALQAETTP